MPPAGFLHTGGELVFAILLQYYLCMLNPREQKRNYFGFLWHAVFLSITITFTEVNTVIPAMILQIGGRELQIGLASAIMIGVPLIAQLNFSGFLHGRPRKKPYLLLGLYLRVLSLALIAVTLISVDKLNVLQSLVLIYGELLLFTLGGAFAGVSYIDLIGKSFTTEMRRRFFTRKQIISSSGILVSALIARQILSVKGYPGNYALLFFAAAGVLLIAGTGFWLIKEAPEGEKKASGYLKTIASIPGILKKDPNMRNYLFYLNSAEVHTALIPFYVSLAKFKYTLGPGLAGNLMFFQISGMVAASMLWPKIVQRGGFKAMLRIWSGLSVVLPLSALGIAWFLPLQFYLLLFFLIGAVVGARTVSRDAVTVELSTTENRVLYTGIIGTMNLSIVLFPILLGLCIPVAGYPVVFVFTACAALVSFLFFHRLNCPVDNQAG